MGQVRHPRDDGDELQKVLEEGAEAAGHDPLDADISADDVGATRLAEALEDEAEDEAEAHPS